ncbi:MAG TPA: hypothetical protein VNN80_00070, partial [Polyangiaceae bacterium]|nr:hypothetical protein [Polyangiaceae bacterium]
ASERVESLGKRIPWLTVDGAEAGSRVLLDGQPFVQLGQEVRQNPGRHQLEVSAPGKRPYSKAFDLPEGQRVNIQLPPLAAESAAPGPASTPQPAPAPPAVDAPSNPSRFGVWPWVAGGTGAALLGTSLVTGLMASSKASQLEKECGDAQRCDPSLEGVRDSAQSLAVTTDVLWISGALILGAGVTLFVIEQTDGDSSALEAGCFDMGCGLRTSGRF